MSGDWKLFYKNVVKHCPSPVVKLMKMEQYTSKWWNSLELVESTKKRKKRKIMKVGDIVKIVNTGCNIPSLETHVWVKDNFKTRPLYLKNTYLLKSISDADTFLHSLQECDIEMLKSSYWKIIEIVLLERFTGFNVVSTKDLIKAKKNHLPKRECVLIRKTDEKFDLIVEVEGLEKSFDEKEFIIEKEFIL